MPQAKLQPQEILNRVFKAATNAFATGGDTGDNRAKRDATEQDLWNLVFDSANNRIRLDG